MSSRSPIWSHLLGGEALRALARNKTRSALSALGITIGVAAVVCVVAMGTSGSERVKEQLQNLGDNLVWVEAGSRNVAGARTGSHGTTSLTLEDAEAIRREVPLVKSVSPQADGNIPIASANKNWTTHYRGVSAEFIDIKRWPVARGTAWTDVDVARSENVVLLGETVRQQLFGSEEAVGAVVRMGTQIFRVVGVLAPKGQTGMGQDQDDTVLLPYTTAQKKLKGRGYEWLDDIMCSAVSQEAAAPATAAISALLRQRHGIGGGQEDDFNIRRPEELLKAQLEAQQTLEFLLMSVACVSLLVGGIGIMNVMLVSVAQRTREIGLRMAVGATEGAVRMQFLGEALLLSLFGGLAGVALGVLASFLIGAALGWPMSIPPQILLIAPVFSLGVGLFFGVYPAWRAAALDPISALRHE